MKITYKMAILRKWVHGLRFCKQWVKFRFSKKATNFESIFKFVWPFHNIRTLILHFSTSHLTPMTMTALTVIGLLILVSLHYFDVPRAPRGVLRSGIIHWVQILWFGALKLDPKPIKNMFFDTFLKFLGFEPNFSASNYQIQTQWTILLL